MLINATLPYCRILRGMKNCKYDNYLTLDREVNAKRKAPRQCSPHAGAKDLIFQRAVLDSVVGFSKLIQELVAQPKLLAFVPIERCLNVGIDDRFVLNAVGFHFGDFAKRSSTSKEECASL